MPKQVDHQARREHLAAALMRVAATTGLESVSLRHVAAEAGVTAGAVQHYFTSKDELMRFAMEAASAVYERRIGAAVAALGEDPAPRVLVGTVLGGLLPPEVSADAMPDPEGRVALAFLAYASTRPDVAAGLAESNAALRAMVADHLRASGAEDPETTATALVALTDGLAVQVLGAGLSPATAAAVLDAQLDLAFAGDAGHPDRDRTSREPR